MNFILLIIVGFAISLTSKIVARNTQEKRRKRRRRRGLTSILIDKFTVTVFFYEISALDFSESSTWRILTRSYTCRVRSRNSRANCGSVAEEDYTLARRRIARATPKRVIVADIYTFVTLPAWLRDSAQDLSVDPRVSRPAIKQSKDLLCTVRVFFSA